MDKTNLREVNIKPVINKSNKQINFSLPKKKVSQKLLDKIHSGKSIKLLFEEE